MFNRLTTCMLNIPKKSGNFKQSNDSIASLIYFEKRYFWDNNNNFGKRNLNENKQKLETQIYYHSQRHRSFHKIWQHELNGSEDKLAMYEKKRKAEKKRYGYRDRDHPVKVEYSLLRGDPSGFEVIAKKRNVKGKRKKFQYYARHLIGMPLDEAMIQMRFARSPRGFVFYSLFRSAQANAVNQFSLNPDYLVIKDVRVGRAPSPVVNKFRGRGGMVKIRLNHSHLYVNIQEDPCIAKQYVRGNQRSNKNNPRIVEADRPQPLIVVD